MSKEIDDIIKGCKKYDRASQKKLYDFTYLSLANVVSLYVKDDSERDWVFNQCMLKVYNSLNSFTLGSNYLAWARTIIVRNSIDHARSHIRHLTIITSIENVKCEEKDDQLERTLGQLAADDIVKTIQHLPVNEKLVFTLFEIEGYSHKEIEKLSKIKENTSKWLLTKARNTLKKYLFPISNSSNFKLT